MNYILIESKQQLEIAYQEIKDNNVIAIDIEFIRNNKAYFPIPCLIQISCKVNVFLIDLLNKDISLSIIKPVLQSHKITKVFHDARQDIEIIYNILNIVPNNIFDTQVAAAVCNIKKSISYHDLIKYWLDINLNKTARLSNWQQRPLSALQLQYARNDVFYLYKIFFKIKDYLDKHQLNIIFQKKMDLLQCKEKYSNLPSNAWKKIKIQRHTSQEIRAIIKPLAQWREQVLQANNIHKKRFMTDRTLIRIAHLQPDSQSGLTDIINNAKNHLSEEHLKSILEIIKASKTAHSS